MKTLALTFVAIFALGQVQNSFAAGGEIYPEDDRRTASNPERLYLFPKFGGIDGWYRVGKGQRLTR